MKRKLTKQTDKLYEQYKKTYKRYQEKYGYNISPILSKKNFLAAREDYTSMGSYHPNLDIVRGQVEITARQAGAWGQNLRRNIKIWKEQDPKRLSELQKTLIEKTKYQTLNRRYFLEQTKRAYEILNIINMANAWTETVGS